MLSGLDVDILEEMETDLLETSPYDETASLVGRRVKALRNLRVILERQLAGLDVGRVR
jgi:hypothetical protein